MVAYKPGVMGYFNHEKTEMIRVFGTRWIPFEKEIKNCTSPAKGFGIHGAPWIEGKGGKLEGSDQGIGKYEGDGCIRLFTSDIEEVYAIITSQTAFVHLVRDYHDADLPGRELAAGEVLR